MKKMSHNTPQQNAKNFAEEVIMIEPINRMRSKITKNKNKAFIFSDKQIKGAQIAINQCESRKQAEQEDLIKDIFSQWKNLVAATSTNNNEREAFQKSIHKLSELSALFTDEVMQDFVLSLQKFITQNNLATLDNPAHRIIIQAHLNVINLTHTHKVKFKNSATANKLFRMLNTAIEQNKSHIPP